MAIDSIRFRNLHHFWELFETTRHVWLPKPLFGTPSNKYWTMNGPRNGFCPTIRFARSRTAAGPVLKLKSGDALELAFIVGDESEPSGFGVSSNPEIVGTPQLTPGPPPRAPLPPRTLLRCPR